VQAKLASAMSQTVSGFSAVTEKRQVNKRCFPVLRPFRALLFMVNDAAANLEIGQHLKQINGMSCRPAGRENQCADVRNQLGKIFLLLIHFFSLGDVKS
jgi:hypothetical protein